MSNAKEGDEVMVSPMIGLMMADIGMNVPAGLGRLVGLQSWTVSGVSSHQGEDGLYSLVEIEGIKIPAKGVRVIYAKVDQAAVEVEERVCQKIRSRSAIGLKKYGVSLTEADPHNPLTWIRHGQLESLDHANYMEKLIEVLENLTCPHCQKHIDLDIHEQPVGQAVSNTGPGDAEAGAPAQA